MEKAVVLLSGGLDSTTLLAMCVQDLGAKNVNALCLSYGQKHVKELESAIKVARYYGVPLVEETVDCFKFSDCNLLCGRDAIPHGEYSNQINKEADGVVSTYVPFRNGLFLSVATAYAYSIGADTVCYGAHADDAAGNAYPDCSTEFVKCMNFAVQAGTANKVKILAPFVNYNKAKIVSLGLSLGVPYELTWSCYEGHDTPCGTCATCLDRIKAFELNGTVDPLLAKMNSEVK
jgi:7-cyano-7-deazaguanine synthase